MPDINLAMNKPKIIKTKSYTIPLNNIDDEDGIISILGENDINSAIVVVWMMHGIYWGRIINKKILLLSGEEFDINLLLEIRIFNDAAELHLVKQGEVFIGRMIVDDVANPNSKQCEYVDAISRFWGKKTSICDDSVILDDIERKLSMKIPVSDFDSEYYGLVTRNYVDVNPITYQAGYIDYRYVRIASADIKKGDK